MQWKRKSGRCSRGRVCGDDTDLVDALPSLVLIKPDVLERVDVVGRAHVANNVAAGSGLVDRRHSQLH